MSSVSEKSSNTPFENPQQQQSRAAPPPSRGRRLNPDGLQSKCRRGGKTRYPSGGYIRRNAIMFIAGARNPIGLRRNTILVTTLQSRGRNPTGNGRKYNKIQTD